MQFTQVQDKDEAKDSQFDDAYHDVRQHLTSASLPKDKSKRHIEQTEKNSDADCHRKNNTCHLSLPQAATRDCESLVIRKP
jgi:hypothetical protein